MPKNKTQEQNESTFIKWGFGKRVPKTEENKFGWENVDLDNIPNNKPIVLCFGGDGTTSEEFANGLAKMTKQLLGMKDTDNFIDIFSIHYNAQNKDSVGYLTDEDINQIAEKLFLPRVTDANGNRLPTKKACQNMRNVNILSHCHGEKVASQIIDKVASAMTTNLGYSEEETKQVLRQALLISYAPYSKPNKYSTNFSVKSLSDDVFVFAEDFFESAEKERYIGAGEFLKKDNTLTLFTESIVGEKENINNPKISEHSEISRMSRDENWMNKNPRSNAISCCMALVLALGVASSQQQSVQDEFVPIPSLDDIESLVKPEIEEVKNSKFEEEDKKFWEYQQNGIAFAELLKYSKITEQDLLSGKIPFADVKKGFKKILYPENSFYKEIERSDVSFPTSLGFNKKIYDKNSQTARKDTREAVAVKIAKSLIDGIVLADGGMEKFGSYEQSKISYKDWLKKSLIKAKLGKKDLTDSVLVEVEKKDQTHQLKVREGIKFREKTYKSINDVFSSITKSRRVTSTLTEEQTRVILNIASIQDIPIQNIKLDKGINLNEKVISQEVTIDKNGIISPNKKTKEQTL